MFINATREGADGLVMNGAMASLNIKVFIGSLLFPIVEIAGIQTNPASFASDRGHEQLQLLKTTRFIIELICVGYDLL